MKGKITSPYGQKYVIEGSLPTPADRTIEVETVWIIDKGKNKPRFVTAYPQGE